VAYIRTKRWKGRTYYSLVECRWDGKPVQKTMVYLPTDSLNPVEFRGTFSEQAQRFIDGYTKAVGRLADEIAASKGCISQNKSRVDVQFHRAKIKRLTAKARRLTRCIRILARAKDVRARES
jgi:pullulanase/glycogen debranching enzyme